jgi:hypothetical protein
LEVSSTKIRLAVKFTQNPFRINQLDMYVGFHHQSFRPPSFSLYLVLFVWTVALPPIASFDVLKVNDARAEETEEDILINIEAIKPNKIAEIVVVVDSQRPSELQHCHPCSSF